MPLNRLYVRNYNYVDDPDSLPMISKLQYEDRHEKALRYIFGRTLICRNIERASELAKSTGLDCVTLEGDKISSKGSMSGGYFNQNRSCLETHNRSTECINLIKDLEADLSALRNELKTIEASINDVVSELQRNETQQGKSKDTFDKMQADIRLMKEELTRIEKFRYTKERSVAQCKLNLEAMNSTKAGLESELQQELLSQLSSQDQRDVDQLNDDIRRLNQENKEAFSARMVLEAKKTKLENLLSNNLFRRREQLLQVLQEISVEDRNHRLQNCRTNVDEVEKRISEVNHDVEVVDKRVRDTTKARKLLQKDLEMWSQKEKEAQEKIVEDSKRSEKWAGKENLLRQKIDECTEKIAALGALPQMDPAYTKMSMKDVSFIELLAIVKNLIFFFNF